MLGAGSRASLLAGIPQLVFLGHFVSRSVAVNWICPILPRQALGLLGKVERALGTRVTCSALVSAVWGSLPGALGDRHIVRCKGAWRFSVAEGAGRREISTWSLAFFSSRGFQRNLKTLKFAGALFVERNGAFRVLRLEFFSSRDGHPFPSDSWIKADPQQGKGPLTFSQDGHLYSVSQVVTSGCLRLPCR